MVDTGKMRALGFLTEQNASQVTLENLIEAIRNQGYQIIYLNRLDNHDAVEQLLGEINCSQYVNSCKAFTYKDGPNKIVFLDDNLRDADKLHLLAHEEGHIYCGHMEREDCSSGIVEDEWEANEFAHYILNPSIDIKIRLFAKNNKKALLITLFTVLLLIIGVVTLPKLKEQSMRNQNYAKTMDYYVTASGSKYHMEGCQYIEGKDIRKITEKEFKYGKYKPCKECIKQEK